MLESTQGQSVEIELSIPDSTVRRKLPVHLGAHRSIFPDPISAPYTISGSLSWALISIALVKLNVILLSDRGGVILRKIHYIWSSLMAHDRVWEKKKHLHINVILTQWALQLALHLLCDISYQVHSCFKGWFWFITTCLCSSFLAIIHISNTDNVRIQADKQSQVLHKSPG